MSNRMRNDTATLDRVDALLDQIEALPRAKTDDEQRHVQQLLTDARRLLRTLDDSAEPPHSLEAGTGGEELA